MDEEGFEDIIAYVLKRKNASVKYITIQLILELCKEMVRISGVWVANRC